MDAVWGKLVAGAITKNTEFSRTLRIVIITTNIFPYYCVHLFINLTAIKISFMDEIFPIPPNSNSDWVYNETKYVVFLLRVKQWMTHSQIIFIFTLDFTQDNEYYLLSISYRIECNWWLEIMCVHFHCIFMKCKQNQQIIKSNHQKMVPKSLTTDCFVDSWVRTYAIKSTCNMSPVPLKIGSH